MTKKVLHIFGAMNRGGAEMRTVSLMPGMNEKHVSFDYCVLSGLQGVLDDEICSLGGRIHYLPLGPMFVYQFISMLRKENYEVVHSHVAMVSGFILLLARLSGVKIRIAHFRNTTDGENQSRLRRLRNTFLRGLIRLCATDILGVCRGALDGFLRHDWKNDDKCQVIYNGFEIPNIPFRQDFWSQYINDYDGQKIILNVSRMDFQKNHLRQVDIFFEMQKRVPDCLLVFVGKPNPERMTQLEKRLSELGIKHKIKVLGLQTQVLDFMLHADLMLFPSLWEGLPGVVLEAASVGLDVVASNLPGVYEISEYIPGVSIVKLSSGDKEWADMLVAKLHEVEQLGAQHQPIRIEQFSRSLFKLSENVQQLYAIYSR